MSGEVVVREAEEADVEAIRALFAATYGEEYPYQDFYDPDWLKRTVFNEDLLTLVAVEDDRLLGTASVVFDVGDHSDLTGEFGRLAVSEDARGKGLGKRLMAARVDAVRQRLHVGVVENRTAHAHSQRISAAHGFAAVGLLPLKHLFARRESIALYVRHFGDALSLRKNHPRVIPEAHALAHLALSHCGIAPDAVAAEDDPPYPASEREFAVEELTSRGLPALLRIERGRVRRREVFGPVGLQHGFFKLRRRQATYLVAREPGAQGAVAGAIGYTRDDLERSLRVFELISREDDVVLPLFEALLARCRGAWGLDYVEVDVSAHAPRLQRTLVQLGFLPAAYVPALVFHHVERLDVIKFVRLFVPPDLGAHELTDPAAAVRDVVMRGFTRQAVLPQLERALDRLTLFEGLSREQAARVASACAVESWDAGASVFRAGEPADAMWIVLEGGLEVQVGGASVGQLEPGEALGEVALLTEDAHSATVVARSPATLARLGAADLARLARQRPDVAARLYRNLALGLSRKLRRVDDAFTRGDDAD